MEMFGIKNNSDLVLDVISLKVLINSGRVVPFFNTRKKLFSSVINKGYDVTLTGYELGYEKKISKMGGKFTQTPVDRSGFNPIKDIILLMTYYKIIKRENIELVHSYTIKPNIYGSIAAKLAGVKNIYPTINGLGYVYTENDVKTKIIRFVTSFLYKLAFSCATKVFFQNSDDAKEMIARNLIKPEKCVIIAGSGIDLEEFTEIPQPKNLSFIMVARLLKSKGVYEYLEAARIVKKRYKDIEFKLVGPLDPNPNGVKKEDLKDFIDEGIINYLGVSNDVHKLIGESSVFVLPSYYREGVPHSILEAMATGRAIITTDSPGCRETVKEGVNGFLVPTQNEKILAKKMIHMIENPQDVKRMGKESIIYAQGKFDVIKVNKLICDTMNI